MQNRTTTWLWRKIAAEVREQGRAIGLPCALCGGARGPIDYRTRAEADRDARAAGEYWLVGAYRPMALDVDHVIPVARGGADTIGNAQQSHAACNREAQAKGMKPKRNAKANKPRPVIGRWMPIAGSGDPLPGRAVPGQRTGTHVFVAD